jgi:hypothetical protein
MRNSLSSISLLSLAFVLLASVPVPAQNIDDFVKGWVERQHVPAVALAVVKNGSLVKAEAYGLADVEHGIAARPDTVFKIGSVSKQLIRHGGSMDGFRAGYTRWPGHDLAVIVLTNLSNAPWEALAANIAIRYVPALKTASPQGAPSRR